MTWCRAAFLAGVAAAAASCSGAPAEPATPPGSTEIPATSAVASTTTVMATTTSVAPTTTTISQFGRPDWLGTKVLPLRADGHGEIRPTPPELQDRRFETIDVLPPPESTQFEWSISPVPEEVLARSSWSESCPVALDELAYVTVSHMGFDGLAHTGELMVNADIAEDVVEVFRQLYDAQFPIEQMRVIRAEEVDAPPTGDGNDTTSFVCRPAVGSTRWSQHAFGLAIDINPFHNPYEKGELVLPELASAYTDRDDHRPGMIMPGDTATAAFATIGWGWGGNWRSLKDWMHFSLTGH